MKIRMKTQGHGTLTAWTDGGEIYIRQSLGRNHIETVCVAPVELEKICELRKEIEDKWDVGDYICVEYPDVPDAEYESGPFPAKVIAKDGKRFQIVFAYQPSEKVWLRPALSKGKWIDSAWAAVVTVTAATAGQIEEFKGMAS